MTETNQTRQQRRAAKRNADSPWKNVPTSPSARTLNRQRYEAEKRRKAEEAEKAKSGIAVGPLEAVTPALR